MFQRCLAAGLLLMAGIASLVSAAPAWAADETFNEVLGRADADASGGLPVLLWVRDGARSSVTIRAPREALGDVPGRPLALADALGHLERLAAPRLVTWPDWEPCPTSLRWARQLAAVRPDYTPPEREALRHAVCGTVDCPRGAWRLVLGHEAADELPLKRLLPGLAVHRVEWLVLYVVSPDAELMLDGLPLLRVPEPLSVSRAAFPWETALPAAAAAHFPELHTALLTHAATAQGLERSVVMRSEGVGIQPLRFARFRISEAVPLQALGLTEESLGWHYLVRLLVRLYPEDRPAVLRPRPAPPGPDRQFMPFRALLPRPGSAESCRARVDQWRCEPACTSRVAAFQQSPSRRLGVAPELSAASDATALLQACLADCERQKQELRASIESNFGAVAARQQQAWRRVEELTGRAAASWQGR